MAVFVKRHSRLFRTNADIHNVPLRNRDKLYLPMSRTALFHKSLMYMSIKIFNKLPDDIKTLPLETFKKKLKSVLIKKCYYEVSNFWNDANII